MQRAGFSPAGWYEKVATPVLASDVIPLADSWGAPALPRLVSAFVGATRCT